MDEMDYADRRAASDMTRAAAKRDVSRTDDHSSVAHSALCLEPGFRWVDCVGPGSGQTRCGFSAGHPIKKPGDMCAHVPLPQHLLVAGDRPSREEGAREVSRARREGMA